MFNGETHFSGRNTAALDLLSYIREKDQKESEVMYCGIFIGRNADYILYVKEKTSES